MFIIIHLRYAMTFDQHNLITMSTDSITIKIISLNVYYNTYKLCNDILAHFIIFTSE